MRKVIGVHCGLFILLFFLAFGLQACCPSGTWKDNFDAIYQLLSTPPPALGLPIQVVGSVDTRGLGCGIWDVRPPLPGEPYDPTAEVVFYAVNPYPDPNDNCCYAYRFEGKEEAIGCVLFIGDYETVGGKCSQSGQMFLEVVTP